MLECQVQDVMFYRSIFIVSRQRHVTGIAMNILCVGGVASSVSRDKVKETFFFFMVPLLYWFVPSFLNFFLSICSSYPLLVEPLDWHAQQGQIQEFSMGRVFSGGGGLGGVPPSGENFVNPPSDTCPRFCTKACPPPAEVRPPKFENFKYIFVSNLTAFKLKSTKKLYFMLKIAKKWPNFASGGQFWLQADFFCKSPTSDFIPVGPTKNFESPHQKIREKTLMGRGTQRLLKRNH